MPESQEITVNHPQKPTEKPGYKTTEFWLTMVALVLGGLIQFDIIPIEGEGTWPKVVALGLQVLAAMGYQVSRGKAKGSSGFTIKLLLLACATAGLLGLGGCSGGTFSAEGSINVELYPDPEGSATTLPITVSPMNYKAPQSDECK